MQPAQRYSPPPIIRRARPPRPLAPPVVPLPDIDGDQPPSPAADEQDALLVDGADEDEEEGLDGIGIPLGDGEGFDNTLNQYVPASAIARQPYGLPELPRQSLGPMSTLCGVCHALHWKQEVSRASARAGYASPFKLCCRFGSVDILPFPAPPPVLRALLTETTPGELHICDPVLTTAAIQFRKNIRSYNNAFAFTSLGVRVDPITYSAGPPVFKIQGQLHHKIGSLLPDNDGDPAFLQVYVTDGTVNEQVERRMNGMNASSLLRPTVDAITRMLAACNPYAQQFRNAQQRINQGEHVSMVLTTIEPFNRD